MERDAQGNVVRAWWADDSDIQDSGIWFPGYFFGKPGETVVMLEDGTEVAYSNSDYGRMILTTQVNVGVGEVSCWGLRTFGQTNRVYLAVSAEEVRRNINPVCRFTFGGSGVGSDAYFAGWLTNATGEVEYAASVHIWPQGYPPSYWPDPYPIVPPDVRVSGLVNGAHYWVEFNFASGFGRAKNQFYPPYEDSGAGLGTVVPATGSGDNVK